MFFYLQCRFTAGAPEIRVLTPESTEHHAPLEQTLYLQPGVQRLETIPLPDGGQLFLLGDPVFRRSDQVAARLCDRQGNLHIAALYTEIPGHYNWFYLRGSRFLCGASFGALFPVYYQIRNDRIFLSSSVFFLAGQTDPGVPDRRHLLERLLFNYPFFDGTSFSKIRLLGAHRQITVTETGAGVETPFAVERHFGAGLQKSAQSLTELTELFEAESRLFLPEAPFAISFTGGFDGRTLVAAARKAGRSDFLTYSFGMPDEPDVTFPAAQAKAVGVPYLPIYLDTDYVNRYALDSAWAFLRLSEFNGNFGRPHYHYAAKLLAEKTGYILTGNFGSEMFRAMHQPGVMMSEALLRIFATRDASWKDFLRAAAGRQAGAFFRAELDGLIADLEQYLDAKKGLDPNQRFYVFVLEEIFRKYFGPELVMQSHYLRNRTPYLSLHFFAALNETVWSGVHARLFEKQKNKRLKGQIFYSAFLHRTDKQLYRLPTNKGYSPADVLETWRRPLLLGRVARQKFLRGYNGDSNAVETYFLRYRGDVAWQIQAQDYDVLLQSGIARQLEKGAMEPDSLEKTIHYYSIAAGWAAAVRATKRAASNQPI